MIIKIKDLQPNMMGIYKINYPNNKIYIGLSRDIKRRMYEHNNAKKAISPCDLAIKKYGKIEEIEILEFINNEKLLDEREKYWIKFYNSNKKEIGYNLNEGGSSFGLSNENNAVSVFSNSQVLDIRKRRYYGERKKDVYKDYSNYSFSSFEKIWLGKGYPNIGIEFIIPTNSISRQEYSSQANDGLKNGRAKCSKDMIIEIRKQFDNGNSISAIQKSFPQVSINTIRRIALRETYKNVE